VGTSPSVSTEFENRRVDVSQYKGKQILVRFVYVSGPTNPALSQPCGWYIDDITLFHGTWNQIGTSQEPSFTVTDRPNGTPAYRVKAIYNDGVTTQASNVEVANVTNSKSLPDAELGRCLKAAGNVILGGATKDTLIGTKGKDVLCGFNGKDKINGKGGNDVIYAGGGNDKARGGGGNDRIFGEKGKDVLSGAKGNDKLKGGPKRDVLKGGAGKDKCGSNAQDTRLKC
jgi:Ca2+-binding RTX toxin-like protein